MHKDNLYTEMTETKERAASWLFRGVAAIIMVLVGIVGYFMTATLNDLKDKIDINNKTTWTAIAESNKSLATLAQTLTGLTTTVNDHVREDAATEASLTRLVQDHENRLRSLEHIPH